MTARLLNPRLLNIYVAAGLLSIFILTLVPACYD